MGAQGTTGAAPGGQPAIPEGKSDSKILKIPEQKTREINFT